MAFLQSGGLLLHSHIEQDFDHIGNEAAGCSQIDRRLEGRKAHVSLPMGTMDRMEKGIHSKGYPTTGVGDSASRPNGQALQCRTVDSSASGFGDSLFHLLYSSDDRKECLGRWQCNRLFFLRKPHATRSSRNIPRTCFLPELLNFFNNISKSQ